jgi:hypothetical protein
LADFIAFTEGLDEFAANGLPATCYFLLSTKSVDATNPFAANNTLSGTTVGEITGTGYARQSQAMPAPSSGVITFAEMSWSTGSATDWPATTRSCVLATTADNTGKAICAWNLQDGGAARDMSAANTTEDFTPTLTLADA